SYIEPPFHANWGKNTYIGNNVYINFSLTIVDDTRVEIKDHVMIGPNVTISTASHPLEPELRLKGAQFNKPVTIEKNVWIGANVTIFPGVTIGERSEEHTSELQSRFDLVCRLLLEKKNT